MTISTPPTEPKSGAGRATRRPAGRTRAAFTLVEVMVAATISSFVLAGVMSAFLMIGRSGYLASNYSEMEAQARRALEIFGDDVRRSSDIRWHSPQSITLSVVTGAGTQATTYAYDPDSGSATYRCFYRVLGGQRSTLPRYVLVRNVESDFAFARFKLEQTGVTDNTANSDLETKQIQLTLRATRTGATTVAANQSALSARFILRNKRVTN